MLERVAPRIASILAGGLAAVLPSRRWFSGKTRPIRAIALDDLAAFDATATTLLALVRVDYADGGGERYTLPLLAIEAGDGGMAGAASDGLTRVGADGSLELFDASLHPPALRAILAGFLDAAPVPTRRGGTLRYEDIGAAHPDAMHAMLDPLPRPLGVEQSNTSFRTGDGGVFKLFRRFAAGENPEIEVSRFLGGTAFRATPRLLGSLTYETPDGERSSLGVLQSFVACESDGWSGMLALLGRTRESEAVAAEARRLGQVTADMHAALGSRADVAGFRPVAVTADDCDRWRTSYAARAARLERELTAGISRLPGPAADSAAVLLTRSARWKTAGDALDAKPSYDLIRVHGDYHLGQTLRTGEGYVIMDFEGEPSRAIAERRAPSAALKDVAGMLRSFEYAEASAMPLVDNAAAVLRGAFLDAYFARAGAADYLPPTPAALNTWQAFFELDKALYEIEYELHHRPDWAWIPLRGMRRLIETEGA